MTGVNCEFCKEPIEGDGVKPVATQEWLYHPECIEVLKIEHGMVIGFLRREEARKAKEGLVQDPKPDIIGPVTEPLKDAVPNVLLDVGLAPEQNTLQIANLSDRPVDIKVQGGSPKTVGPGQALVVEFTLKKNA